MSWLALTYTIPSSQVDLVNAELTGLGYPGTLMTELSPEQSNLTVYLDEQLAPLVDQEAAVDQMLFGLVKNGVDLQPLTKQRVMLNQSDWADNWKAYYHAERITSQLTVVPAWEDYQKQQDGEKLIRMDPQLSFGTGTHETTRLSLQALETVVRGGEQVIDVGTGSGVLAVAAKLLGVNSVLATDIDQEAVGVAQDNLALNPSAGDIQVVASDLLADVSLTGVDIIVANILADVIEPLIPQAFDKLKNGGYFLVSGIYSDQSRAISDSLLVQGFTIQQTMSRGDWYGFIAVKGDD